MANKKVDPTKKVYPLWASVTIDVKVAVEEEAKKLGITPAKLAGRIVTEYAKARDTSSMGKGDS